MSNDFVYKSFSGLFQQSHYIISDTEVETQLSLD